MGSECSRTPLPEITPAGAAQICHDFFPKGPERLAEMLGVVVHSMPLVGCDGWCCRGPAATVVCINSRALKTRQRFTLAHELAHLLLGSVPETMTRGLELASFGGRSEEAEANRLAAELLLPGARLSELLPKGPIDQWSLKRLAKKAAVSMAMAACRVAEFLRPDQDRALWVVAVEGEKQRWRWPGGPHDLDIASIRQRTLKNPAGVRLGLDDGSGLFSFMIRSVPYPLLIVQRLPPGSTDLPATLDERRRGLEQRLFDPGTNQIHCINGQYSSFLGRLPPTDDMSQLVEAFVAMYQNRWDDQLRSRMCSPQGREYLELRFRQRL